MKAFVGYIVEAILTTLLFLHPKGHLRVHQTCRRRRQELMILPKGLSGCTTGVPNASEVTFGFSSAPDMMRYMKPALKLPLSVPIAFIHAAFRSVDMLIYETEIR